MRGLLDPAVPPATVAGMDLIRDADGELLVLEDNLRMPSGATYAIAVREAVGPELGSAAAKDVRQPDRYVERLGEAIRSAAPSQHAAEPAAAILSDGPESGAYYEHERLGRELGLPIVTPDQLSQARGRLHARVGRERLQLDVVYRRLDADRLTDRGGVAHPARRAPRPGARIGPAALRQRDRHRPRRRQARPRLRRRDGPLLPRRGAAAALGPELRPLRSRGARRGRRPPRRAGGEAARRLRRPRRDDHAARHRGRATQGDRARAAAAGALRRPGAGAALHPPDRGRRRPRPAPGRPAPLRPQPGGGRAVRDAGRAHPLRQEGRGDGRQQLPGRWFEGHLGTWDEQTTWYEDALLGIPATTALDRGHDLRGPPERADPSDAGGRPLGQRDGPRPPLPDGDRGGGRAAAGDPADGHERDRAAARPAGRHLASPAGPTSTRRCTRPSRIRSWGRSSPTSTASRSTSPPAPTPARCRSWRSAAAPRR